MTGPTRPVLRRGHHGAGLIASVPIVVSLGPGRHQLAVLAIVLALIGARLPDVDRVVPFVPHRGPTHTVWFAASIAVASTLVTSNGVPGTSVIGGVVGASTFLGVISHLAADGLTPAGVRPFWPVWERSVSLSIWTADNDLANSLLLVAGILAVGVVLGGDVGQFLGGFGG